MGGGVTGAAGIEGAVLRRGGSGYAAAREEAVWNGLKPERYPEVIVRVASERDVPAALALARSEGLRVSVRSGGHHWSGAQLRDGALLLDLSRLRRCEVDPGSATAEVGPATTGSELVAALTPHDLAFPVGHCPSVAMGGFLLSGGLGWNSREWGPSCADVLEVEVVTADGRTLRCDAERNADLFWAARGAGPAFFGVVTRFRLGLHPLPGSVMTTALTFPLNEVGRVTEWAVATARQLPPNTEVSLVLTASGGPAPSIPPGPRITVGATAFTPRRQEALDALGVVDACPLADAAVSRQEPESTSFAALQEGAGATWPRDHRYAADTLWSAEDYATQLNRAADAISRAPSGRSLVLAPILPVSQDPTLLRNMAFSTHGESYLVGYGVWDDPSGDEANLGWLRETMAALDPRGEGHHYIGEADLAAGASRAERSFRAGDWDRLRGLKARWDPEDLFAFSLAP